MWYGDTADIPGGWVLCDGTNGTPDLRGRVPVGLSADTEFNTLGKTGGAKTHTLSIAEMPSHNHSFGGDSYGEHAYSPFNFPLMAETHNVTRNVSNTGGGLAHNNLQPYTVVHFIMKI